MNPFPGPRSVLVMDNASTHYSPLVRKLCREAGVVIEYLPPYSPDLSPIEESFSVLKKWMRRNRESGKRLAEQGGYELFIYTAIAACNFRTSGRAFFRGCGIEVPDDEEDEDYDALLTGDDVLEDRAVEWQGEWL